MESDKDRRGPSFICVGSPRCGTTWLNANLKRHPQIWLPPVKELNYFNLECPGGQAYWPFGGGRRMARRQRRVYALRLLRRTVRLKASPRWTAKYIFGRRSDDWYAGLFPGDRVAGEISPLYVTLPQVQVEAIHRLNPQMKIILQLRNPVSRAWSWGCLHRGRKGFDDNDRFECANSPQCQKMSKYVPIINTWRGVFGDEQVHVSFYDDLMASPGELFRSILNFLGVDSGDAQMPEDVERKVNSSRKHELPERFVAPLYAAYMDDLRELGKMFGGHVSKWLAKGEAALAKGTGDDPQPPGGGGV